MCSTWADRQQKIVLSSTISTNFGIATVVTQMRPNHTNNTNPQPTKRRKRSCGICGKEGHDRRLCPSRPTHPQELDQNTNSTSTPPPRNNAEAPNRVNEHSAGLPQDGPALNQCIFVVLDLETTGLSRTTNNIIEVAAEVLSHEGIPVEDGVYSSLIRPPSPIPTFITELTGITQEMVEDKEDFATTIKEFFKFIEDRRHAIEETTSSPANHVVFVGHNAVRFFFFRILIHDKFVG